MSQQIIEEAIELLEGILGELPDRLEDPKDYEDMTEIHARLTILFRTAEDVDQLAIDLIDEYDARKFKEALGL